MQNATKEVRVKCRTCRDTKLLYRCTGPGACGKLHRKEELKGHCACPACGNPQAAIVKCPDCKEVKGVQVAKCGTCRKDVINATPGNWKDGTCYCDMCREKV